MECGIKSERFSETDYSVQFQSKCTDKKAASEPFLVAPIMYIFQLPIIYFQDRAPPAEGGMVTVVFIGVNYLETRTVFHLEAKGSQLINTVMMAATAIRHKSPWSDLVLRQRALISGQTVRYHPHQHPRPARCGPKCHRSETTKSKLKGLVHMEVIQD